MLTLYHYPLCPHSRSIRLALGELGFDFQLVEELPWAWREEFLRLNPSGALPVLLMDDGTVLCGVYAISEFLDETAAVVVEKEQGFRLFPGDPYERAEARRLTDWFHRKFDVEVSLHILEEKIHIRFGDGVQATPNMAALRAGYDNLAQHLRYVNFLARDRNWLAGENLSFADFAAASHLSCIDYLGDVAWDEFEMAKIWYARVKSRPAFRPFLLEKLAGLSPPDHYADLDF